LYGAVLNPAFVDPSLDSRAVTFENPTGARGAGGTVADGRKGRPSKVLAGGSTVVLADLEGPGTLRHFWLTTMPAPPEVMRSLALEIFYDGAPEPSVSVPMLDFFGMPLGRPVAFASALQSSQEGHGFNSYLPMPFRRGVKVELTNSSSRAALVYYQLDYTLEAAVDETSGYLHATFRRENPTTLRRDFVIADGLAGPGRYLGCNVGIRVIDAGNWYGEGEVKIYRDGDTDLPTICGTGLEDYVGSGWGMGAHAAPFGGAPLVVGPPPSGGGGGAAGAGLGTLGSGEPTPGGGGGAELVGFYRWHLHDPVMYRSELKVTLQQIGSTGFREGEEAAMEAYFRTNPPAGRGPWLNPAKGVLAFTLAERVDDVCATAYLYATTPQAVPRADMAAAVADIGRRPYETADPLEQAFGTGD
jgi:hypothetical protein